MVAGKGTWATNDVITAAGLNQGYDASGNIALTAGEHIEDANGNEIVEFTQTAAAVNNIIIANSATTVAPSILPKGETGINLIVNDNTIITNDLQLTGSTADGFPNTTTLYIWDAPTGASGNYTNQIGGIDLTLTGTTTQSNDVLGVSRYNVFDGSNDYLSSNNAAFNFTGDFSLVIWAKATDWSPAANNCLISRRSDTGSANGWNLMLNTTSQLVWNTLSAGATTSEVLGGTSGISDGSWLCVAITRDADVGTQMYFNGVLIGSVADADQVITAAGNLEVGSADGGQYKFNGSIGQIVVHKDTILTADEVRNIYARSAKKFAVKAQDGTVSIAGNPMARQPYATGLWTPTRNGFTEGGSGGSYATTGTYVRIGKMVILTATLSASGGNTLAAVAGASYLSGIPFAVETGGTGTWVNITDGNAGGYVYAATTNISFATGWTGATNKTWILQVIYSTSGE